MQCYKAAFILSLLFCPFLASAAGVAIAGTRVIYNEQSHEADITVKNTNPHDPVLIQSWVTIWLIIINHRLSSPRHCSVWMPETATICACY